MAAIHFYRIQKALCIVLFCLIILGAAVRIADAGLACPDWPLCFGEIVPDFNFKIFMEWFHRLIAGISGILALLVSIGIWKNRILRSRLGVAAGASILLFGFQAFLGMQTVLQFLRSDKVTAHLMGGYSLFALNLYILFKWSKQRPQLPRALRCGFGVLLVLTFFQATLGGMVSSHYAGMACAEFPKCQGQWWPDLVGTVAYHFFHRLGAVILFIASAFFTYFVYKKSKAKAFRLLSVLGFLLILLQWIWGVSMVMNAVHPAFSIAHSATALVIFTVYAMGALSGPAR